MGLVKTQRSTDVMNWKNVFFNLCALFEVSDCGFNRAHNVASSTFGDINDRNSNHAVTYVGKDSSSGSHGYAGSMQDMRVYADLLTPVQIRNLFRGKARRDITPTSGYLEFG